MKISGIFSCLLLSVASVIAKEKNIINLNEDDFFPCIYENPFVFVKYCAPWYSKCNEIQKEFVTAANNMKESNVIFAEVDCTLEQGLCINNGVDKYPKFQLHREGTVLDFKYENVTSTEIELFVNSFISPAITEVDEESLEKMKKENDKVVTVFLEDRNSDEYQALFRVARNLRDKFKFVYSFDKELAKKNNVELPSVVFFKKFSQEKNDVKEGKITELSLVEFIGMADLPLMDNLSAKNYNTYLSQKIPLLYFFIDDQKYEETVGKDLEELARKYRLKMNFIYVDANKYGEKAESLGIKEEWPTILIQDTQSKLKYLFDSQNGFGKAELEKYIADYFDGKVKSFYHSEVLEPQAEGDHLIRMNAYTFEEVALNKFKDVFVLFHADYCKPCRESIPILREIANEIEPKKNFAIAYIDATKNDIPGKSPFSKIDGFPTLVLFRGNRENEPIVFPTNDYYKEDFIDFIEQYSVHDPIFKDEEEEEKKPEEKKEEKQEDKDEL